MKWVLLAVLAWLLFKLARWIGGIWAEVVAEADVAARPQTDLGDARHRLLALAEPMARRAVGEAFLQSAVPVDREALERRLRAALLHLFGLRGDITAEQLRAELPPLLRSRWFGIDLENTPAEDDPAAALAFACGRVAFAVRSAGLLGWIDDDTQWQVLQQNAQRAAECFAGWQEYGSAWARGRRQWVARARADGLGQAFSEADVREWTEDRSHPWGYMPWGEATPAGGAASDPCAPPPAHPQPEA